MEAGNVCREQENNEIRRNRENAVGNPLLSGQRAIRVFTRENQPRDYWSSSIKIGIKAALGMG